MFSGSSVIHSLKDQERKLCFVDPFVFKSSMYSFGDRFLTIFCRSDQDIRQFQIELLLW